MQIFISLKKMKFQVPHMLYGSLLRIFTKRIADENS